MQDPFNQPPIPPSSGYNPPPGGYNPPPGGPQVPPSDNKKLAAGLCGILLGSLGIHKFVLGYTTEGVIMLLVSVLGYLPTCGMSPYVIWIIGLIEGILYLVKTDQEFYQTYVVNKRPWF